MITRESFLAIYAIPPPVEPVGDAFVRAMTAGEKDRFDLAHTKAEGKDFRSRLLVASVCDESGSLLFTEGDMPALSRLPLPSIEPLVDAIMRINRIGEKEQADLRKNLNGPNGDSSSVSASSSGPPSASLNPDSLDLSLTSGSSSSG